LYGKEIGGGYFDGINGGKTGEDAKEKEEREHEERAGLV
jgi:hypothetical protein